MDLKDISERALARLDPRLANAAYRALGKLRFVRRRVEGEYGEVMAEMEKAVKPYRDRFPSRTSLPERGVDREQILREMEELREAEEARWKDGYVSGAVYHGDPGHIEFLNRVYALNSQANPLHSDIWPSTTKHEAEIVAMTASMLGGDGGTCGTVSSGGTESILLAMKAYRDHARAERSIRHPEMVTPSSAHAAFDKAARYFNIKKVTIPVTRDFTADVEEARKAVTRNTVVVVGSAPCFPHGVIDPIEELSALARERLVGFHTDACLGGFVLPFAEKLGHRFRAFDFRLPGVTSISVDTHKYGYAAKGTSVILYRSRDLRRHQYYTTTDWPGGLYFSPTFAGSRPGALSSACYAALVSMGEQGYIDATRRILSTATTIRRGIQAIPELHVLGDPLWVIAFASRTLDIYRVMDRMTSRGWSLNGLHRPACVHICVTLRHTQPGVAERFIEDLRASVVHVRDNPDDKGTMAPVYGMAATLPVRAIVGDMLERYMDLLYKV